MFLTITIDTTRQKKNKVRMHKKRFNPTQGWHRGLNKKRRSFWDKFIKWKKDVKKTSFSGENQVLSF